MTEPLPDGVAIDYADGPNYYPVDPPVALPPPPPPPVEEVMQRRGTAPRSDDTAPATALGVATTVIAGVAGVAAAALVGGPVIIVGGAVAAGAAGVAAHRARNRSRERRGLPPSRLFTPRRRGFGAGGAGGSLPSGQARAAKAAKATRAGTASGAKAKTAGGAGGFLRGRGSTPTAAAGKSSSSVGGRGRAGGQPKAATAARRSTPAGAGSTRTAGRSQAASASTPRTPPKPSRRAAAATAGGLAASTWPATGSSDGRAGSRGKGRKRRGAGGPLPTPDGLPRTRVGAWKWSRTASPATRRKLATGMDRMDKLSPRRRRNINAALDGAARRDRRQEMRAARREVPRTRAGAWWWARTMGPTNRLTFPARVDAVDGFSDRRRAMLKRAVDPAEQRAARRDAPRAQAVHAALPVSPPAPPFPPPPRPDRRPAQEPAMSHKQDLTEYDHVEWTSSDGELSRGEIVSRTKSSAKVQWTDSNGQLARIETVHFDDPDLTFVPVGHDTAQAPATASPAARPRRSTIAAPGEAPGRAAVTPPRKPRPRPQRQAADAAPQDTPPPELVAAAARQQRLLDVERYERALDDGPRAHALYRTAAADREQELADTTHARAVLAGEERGDRDLARQILRQQREARDARDEARAEAGLVDGKTDFDDEYWAARVADRQAVRDYTQRQAGYRDPADVRESLRMVDEEISRTRDPESRDRDQRQMDRQVIKAYETPAGQVQGADGRWFTPTGDQRQDARWRNADADSLTREERVRQQTAARDAYSERLSANDRQTIIAMDEQRERAGLAADHSLETRQLHETAGSARDHEEGAAQRARWILHGQEPGDMVGARQVLDRQAEHRQMRTEAVEAAIAAGGPGAEVAKAQKFRLGQEQERVEQDRRLDEKLWGPPLDDVEARAELVNEAARHAATQLRSTVTHADGQAVVDGLSPDELWATAVEMGIDPRMRPDYHPARNPEGWRNIIRSHAVAAARQAEGGGPVVAAQFREFWALDPDARQRVRSKVTDPKSRDQWQAALDAETTTDDPHAAAVASEEIPAPPRAAATAQEGTTMTSQSTMTRRANYDVHPCQQGMIDAHAQLMNATPHSIIGAMGLMEMMGEAFDDTLPGHVAGTVQFYSDARPFHPSVMDYLSKVALAYRGTAEEWRELYRAYVATNAEDVDAAENPHPAEAFNNVPDGAEQGEDLGPLVQQFVEEHQNAFGYRSTDPLDQVAWFEGLYQGYLQMGAQAENGFGLAMFPGVEGPVAEARGNVSRTYLDMADQAAATAEEYESTDSHNLGRHRDPRQDEHLANATRQ